MSTAQQPGQALLMATGCGLGADPDWRQALEAALGPALEPLGGEPPDLLFLFASDHFREEYGLLLRETAERSGAREMAGCSGQGVIGAVRELEGRPGVAVLALRFPAGSYVSVRAVEQEEVEVLSAASGPADRQTGPGEWPSVLGLRPAACTGIVVLADPFTLDIEGLIAGLGRDYPGVPVVGGLASSSQGARRTYLFSGTQVASRGAVLVGLGGNVALKTVVSQGCEPIGRAWTVTEAHGHVVSRVGNRPAYEVLVQTLQDLSETERRRAARNLLVGLAMDEYHDTFKRGDFLIRNLIGVDQSSGAIAIAAQPRVGQTLQFQVRDARAADEELRHLLARAAEELSEPPAGALLFACNGRGAGLFGEPDHDARLTNELLGALPVAGFFCNGEIGPVGGGTYLHGFTASLGLIVPKD